MYGLDGDIGDGKINFLKDSCNRFRQLGVDLSSLTLYNIRFLARLCFDNKSFSDKTSELIESI